MGRKFISQCWNNDKCIQVVAKFNSGVSLLIFSLDDLYIGKGGDEIPSDWC